MCLHNNYHTSKVTMKLLVMNTLVFYFRQKPTKFLFFSFNAIVSQYSVHSSILQGINYKWSLVVIWTSIGGVDIHFYFISFIGQNYQYEQSLLVTSSASCWILVISGTTRDFTMNSSRLNLMDTHQSHTVLHYILRFKLCPSLTY